MYIHINTRNDDKTHIHIRAYMHSRIHVRAETEFEKHEARLKEIEVSMCAVYVFMYEYSCLYFFKFMCVSTHTYHTYVQRRNVEGNGGECVSLYVFFVYPYGTCRHDAHFKEVWLNVCDVYACMYAWVRCFVYLCMYMHVHLYICMCGHMKCD
jgi:hypothetical protein